MKEERVEAAYKLLSPCVVCPRACQVDRLKNELGICRSGLRIKISSVGPHFGEEPPLSGTRGSGTIFFSNCNLRCLFCQNWQISHEGLGSYVTEEELAEKMLELQAMGVHNINLVSPTHFGPQILKALVIAKNQGLCLPIVYNSGGYDSVEMLKLFEGYIDIYLPDIKYSSNENALKFSGVKNYVVFNRAAISEMFRQVGNLELDKKGMAKRGIIVRHLVLPFDLAGSYESLKFLASLSQEIWISLMAQYYPCYKAIGHPLLGRKITPQEYQQVLTWAEEFGLKNLLTQELDSAEMYLPDFQKKKPFNHY
jgi:putative pyruvate formate lyase activating enzyme